MILRTRFVTLACVAALALSACAVNPFKTANTATADNKPETIALATFGMFVIVEEAAADLKENAATPPNVRDSLKQADALASPAAESLRDAAITVKGLRASISAGQGGDLPGALLKLNQLLTDSAPKLQKLTDAFNKAKGK